MEKKVLVYDSTSVREAQDEAQNETTQETEPKREQKKKPVGPNPRNVLVIRDLPESPGLSEDVYFLISKFAYYYCEALEYPNFMTIPGNGTRKFLAKSIDFIIDRE